MGELAVKTMKELAKKLGKEKEIFVERVTVPGIKDLPVAAKKLIEERGCEAVLACGQVGKHSLDEMSAMEANIGVQVAQLMTNKHILTAFIHEQEAPGNEEKLVEIIEDRVSKHAENLVRIVVEPRWFQENAGKGLRQGDEHAGAFRK
jgi:riboflavin synthase